MPQRNQNLIGKVVGHLKVLRKSKKRGTESEYMWVCQCDCGRTTLVSTSSLNYGSVTSCGHNRTKNLKPSKKRHLSQLSDKPPVTSTTGYRNISITYRHGKKYYRVAVIFDHIQHGGLRRDLKSAIEYREELRKKYWPNYQK